MGVETSSTNFHIALLAPEIPPNTGAIIRLCANTRSHLHLIEPLGFDLSDASLKRAGLDYHELAEVSVHANLATCLEELKGASVFAFSKRCHVCYTLVPYSLGDVLLFGSESSGLPDEVLESFPEANQLVIPMAGGRSLNLANAVSVVVYEAWRQNGFKGK